MKRLLTTLIVVGLVFSQVAIAQKKDEKKPEISRPPWALCFEIKDKENDVTYTIIPYEVASPLGHKKCRELIKESEAGFMFFIVIIDNRKSSDPIEFNAFGGDATFYYYPPKKNPKDKKEVQPDPSKYGFVALQNFFVDPGNTPADKAGYKKIQEQFKTALKVPAGSIGWSLCCIRDAFKYDLKQNRVTWAIPGKLPQDMKIEKFNKGLLKKAKVELFGEKEK